MLKSELVNLESQIKQIQGRSDYLGLQGIKDGQRLENQLNILRDQYRHRKRACFDLIDVFTSLYQEDEEQFRAKVGLDEDDFNDEDI